MSRWFNDIDVAALQARVDALEGRPQNPTRWPADIRLAYDRAYRDVRPPVEAVVANTGVWVTIESTVADNGGGGCDQYHVYPHEQDARSAGHGRYVEFVPWGERIP